MTQKECIAMVLAGGKGARLGALTANAAKPMVHFGGRYRIIDFTLSNCAHSGMDTLGVLTQYQPLELHDYIRSGRTWRLDRKGGVFLLPSSETGEAYTGTANAVYQNTRFIEQFNPEYVLILSGDHIYKMDYEKMLRYHKKTGADATIAVIPVPLEEASRFGIMNTAENGLITEFEEKPKKPGSNLASMGIYIFNWRRLKEYLAADQDSVASQNDFGRNIIPAMLAAGEKMYAYSFNGYWKDVGTVQSLWESNMDLIDYKFNLFDEKWEILTRARSCPPLNISVNSSITNSIVSEGCNICGEVENSVLYSCVSLDEGAEITDSVIMPGASIGKNTKIHKAIIGANARIGDNVEIGADDGMDLFFDNVICSKDISLIGPRVSVGQNVIIYKNSHVGVSVLPQRRRHAVMNRENARLEVAHI